MGPGIRNLRASDLESYADLLMTTSRNEYQGLTRQNMMELVNGLDRDWAFVAVDEDDRPVGFASARLEGCVLHLLLLDVEPELQGKGIGKRLLAHLIGLGHDSNAKTMRCEVWDGNENGIDFYTRNGFERTRLFEGYYPSGRNALIMVRQI